MQVSIMQPTFLPWVGYFDLIDRVDAFVFLDSVKYSRQSWQQRNRVKTAGGMQWLTLPVVASERAGTTIAEARLGDVSILKKYLRTVEQAYRRAPYFERYFAEFASALDALRPGDRLAEVNMSLIEWMCRCMEIDTQRVRASSLQAASGREDRLIGLCRGLGADAYLSPVGAFEYLEKAIPAFEAAGIQVSFHAYVHPQYPQLHPPFAPNAAALDLLMNCGPRALEVVRSGRLPDQSPAGLGGSRATAHANSQGDGR